MVNSGENDAKAIARRAIERAREKQIESRDFVDLLNVELPERPDACTCPGGNYHYGYPDRSCLALCNAYFHDDWRRKLGREIDPAVREAVLAWLRKRNMVPEDVDRDEESRIAFFDFGDNELVDQ